MLKALSRCFEYDYLEMECFEFGAGCLKSQFRGRGNQDGCVSHAFVVQRESGEWIVDAGATGHLSNNKAMIRGSREVGEKVKRADDSNVSVLASGSKKMEFEIVG